MKKSSLITAGCLLAALLAFAPAIQAQGQGTLKSITTQMEGARLVVTIAIEGAFTREVSYLTSPKRLVVDLNGVAAIEPAPYAQVGQGGVLDIRTGQFKPETARVVFDLGQTTPAYTVTEVPGGLKIDFWLEAGEETIAPAAGGEAVKEPERVRPVRERTTQETPAESGPAGSWTGMFVRVGGGWALFFKSYTAEAEFPYFGETARGIETHTWKSGIAGEAAIGKRLLLGSLRTKAGLEISYWQVKPEFGAALSLPHPFLADASREVDITTSEGLATSLMRFSLFAEFMLLESDKFSLSLGPVLGLTVGKLFSVSDYGFNDVSPFAAENVSFNVEDMVIQEDALTAFHIGAILGLEYRLSRHLSLSLDTKLLLFSPASAVLTESFNMMHVQPTLSLQYNF